MRHNISEKVSSFDIQLMNRGAPGAVFDPGDPEFRTQREAWFLPSRAHS